MFNSFLKWIAHISVAILVFNDVYVLGNAIASGSGQNIFNAVLENLVPCSLLVGVTVFLNLIESKAKKPLAITTLVINSVLIFTRVLVLGVMIYEFTIRTEPLYANEITYLVSFLAYLLLMVANVFLMVYLLGGKFQKTAQNLVGVSAIALIIDFIAIAYFNITAFLDAGGSGIFAIFVSAFNEYNSLLNILLVIAYVMVFGAATKVFAKDDK